MEWESPHKFQDLSIDSKFERCISPTGESDCDTNENDKVDEDTIFGLGRETVKGLYKLTDEDLNYKPPTRFVLKIDDADMKTCFDFETGKFIKGCWPQIIDKNMAQVQKVCSFRASGCPTYNTRTANVFCRMRGNCGGDCNLKFVITVSTKPKRGRTLECKVHSRGVSTISTKVHR